MEETKGEAGASPKEETKQAIPGGSDSSKPEISKKRRYLILGGLGFIGKALFEYLHENSLASFIGIIDKQVPSIAYIHSTKKELYKRKDPSSFLFIQADLTKEEMVESAFNEMGDIDVVVNAAGDSTPDQPKSEYDHKITKIVVVCSSAAAKRKYKQFIHLSTALVYGDCDGAPARETNKLEPWGNEALAQLEAEKRLLQQGAAIQVKVLRLPIVYGPGNFKGVLASMIASGVVYKHSKEGMPMIWNEELKRGTIHIGDVVRAIEFLVENGAPGEVYNLADDNATDNGKITAILSDIFGIKVEYAGTLKSVFFTKFNLESGVDSINQKHMTAWLSICGKQGIQRTPVELVLYKDLIRNNNLWVSNEKIKKSGFRLNHQKMTRELILAQYRYAVDEGYMPDVIGIKGKPS